MIAIAFVTNAKAEPARAPDSAPARAPANAPASAPKLFPVERYMEGVQFLASEELTGRGVETDGSRQASEYIARAWQGSGVVPGMADGTWFQSFEVPSQKVLEPERAELKLTGIERPLAIGVDWTPLPYSAIGDADGPLAFAGYGIDAPEFDYDDYLDIDVTGKVVLIFRYEPRATDAEAEFGGTDASRFATFREKAETAAKRGAKALLIVNPPDHPLGAADGLIAFERWLTRPTYDLPMAQITQKVAEELLRSAGMPPLREMQRRLDSDRQSWSEDLPHVQVSLRSGLRKARGRNVVGVRHGSDPSTSDTIVIGAHYDHLGNRPAGDEPQPQIHNGADDNASGAAGLIELARAFSNSPTSRRAIVLIAFDGEELGLLGSKHFVINSPWPVSGMKTMINLDMIGRYRPHSFEISGVGTADGAAERIERAAAGLGLEYKLRERVRRDSDQQPFDGQAVPTFFIHTGMHADYHRPTDDTDKLDPDAAVRILEFTRRLALELADMESGPEYQSQDSSAPASSPASASAPAGPRAGRDSVRLGFMPKDDSKVPGVVVETVVEGGAGAAAGLKAGDRLLKLGERDIQDINDYFESLAGFKPDDSTTLRVARDNTEQNLNVTFTRSRRPDPS